MTSKKILLAEDDSTLAFLIVDNLKREGYNVVWADNGQKALNQFNEIHFDICLLDVMMPQLDGFSLAKSIRLQNKQVPIIFLTARNFIDDKLKGLRIGADDYLTKPFSMEELLLKIQVFIKRSTVSLDHTNSDIFHFGKFEFDFENLKLKHDQNSRELTMKEARLLKYLCQNPQKVLNRSDILKQVWGDDDYFLGRSLDVFISRLRKYLKSDSSVRITNLHGIGFRFEF